MRKNSVMKPIKFIVEKMENGVLMQISLCFVFDCDSGTVKKIFLGNLEF